MSRSEKFWDRMAVSYDRDDFVADPASLHILEKTKTYLSPSAQVLDFGCGTGGMSLEIAAQAESVVGVDTSAQMIERAKAKAIRRQIGNVEYVQASLYDERFTAGGLDAVFACYVLHLVADTPRLLRRVDELLKPGGVFISATPCLGGNSALMRGAFRFGGTVGMIPKVNIFTFVELERTLQTAGFEIAESECLRQKTQEYFIAARKKQIENGDGAE